MRWIKADQKGKEESSWGIQGQWDKVRDRF